MPSEQATRDRAIANLESYNNPYSDRSSRISFGDLPSNFDGTEKDEEVDSGEEEDDDDEEEAALIKHAQPRKLEGLRLVPNDWRLSFFFR